MNHVYAECPVHGAFESAFVRGDIQGLTMAGNLETCPQCGRMSKTIEGTFNIGPEMIEILSAPQWTKALLRQVRDSLADAKEAVSQASNEHELAEAIADLRQDIQALNKKADFMGTKLDAFITEQTQGKSKERILWFIGIALAVFLWAVPASDMVRFTQETVSSIIESLPEFLGDAPTPAREGPDTEGEHSRP